MISKLRKSCEGIKPELLASLKQRLQGVLEKYDKFEEHFVDEVEVILLYGIRENTPWKVV